MTGLLRLRLDGAPVMNGHAQVVDGLGRDIVAGRLAEGTILPGDDALAERFGVSRTVLREAMKTLAAKGMVRARPRVGTRVLDRRSWNLLDAEVLGWHVDDSLGSGFLDQLAEMRLAVEPAIAALAARRARPEAIEAMRRAVDEMERATDDRAFALADLDFHKHMIEASGNLFMHSAGVLIEAALLSVFHLGSPASDADVQAEVTEAHRNAAEEIASGREAGAAEAARHIINLGRDRVRSEGRSAAPPSRPDDPQAG